jgi:hypothetical protein
MRLLFRPKKSVVRSISPFDWNATSRESAIMGIRSLDMCSSVERVVTYLQVFRTTGRIEWVH